MIFVFFLYLDFWTCGTRSQAHFKIPSLRFRKVNHFRKMPIMSTNNLHFSGFRVPPSCASGGSCLRRFGDIRKNTPWNFGACILWILSMFVDFRVHQVVNSSTTLHLYTYLCVLAPPWSYSTSEIRNPAKVCPSDMKLACTSYT